MKIRLQKFAGAFACAALLGSTLNAFCEGTKISLAEGTWLSQVGSPLHLGWEGATKPGSADVELGELSDAKLKLEIKLTSAASGNPVRYGDAVPRGGLRCFLYLKAIPPYGPAASQNDLNPISYDDSTGIMTDDSYYFGGNGGRPNGVYILRFEVSGRDVNYRADIRWAKLPLHGRTTNQETPRQGLPTQNTAAEQGMGAGSTAVTDSDFVIESTNNWGVVYWRLPAAEPMANSYFRALKDGDFGKAESMLVESDRAAFRRAVADINPNNFSNFPEIPPIKCMTSPTDGQPAKETTIPVACEDTKFTLFLYAYWPCVVRSGGSWQLHIDNNMFNARYR